MDSFDLKHCTLIIHAFITRFLSLSHKNGFEILFLDKIEGKDSIGLQFQYRLGKPSGSRFFAVDMRKMIGIFFMGCKP